MLEAYKIHVPLSYNMVSSTEQISLNYFTKNYVVSLMLLYAAILYVWVKTKEIFREIK